MNQAIKPLLLVGVLAVIIFFATRSQQEPETSQENALFSTSTAGLPEGKLSDVIDLKNGDTYGLTAEIVKKNINGQQVKMLAYNGSIPGPLIKIPKNAEVTINFTNNTDVESTVHSHGVRVDNAFDGVPDVTQKVVPVGGTFAYKLKFPDEGIYWYHPHFREDYAQELGLYGNYLVVSDDPNYWAPANRELPLVLDDILLRSDGSVAPFSTTTADHALMGRFGNTMLVNGETSYQLNAQQGEVIRFYLTNTANVRPFNVMIPGAKIKLVGGDSGKYEREAFVDSVLLGPSERAVVDVLFDKPGAMLLQHVTPAKTYALGSIQVSAAAVTQSFAQQFSALRINQDVIASINPLRTLLAKPADKNLALTIDMMGMAMGNTQGGHGMHMMPDGSMMSNQMMGSGDPIEWEDDMAMMNQLSTSNTLQWKIADQDTGEENMDINWKFSVGDIVKVKIFNDPNSMHPMQHPIHFHGQRFLVASRDGIQNDNLVWKDTVLVGSGEVVELLVDMSNPGEWMAHCHISEHLEDGMMFGFTVDES